MPIYFQAYVHWRSQLTYTTLVHRYIYLVFSVALRQVANHHMAEDVTQAGSLVLSQKAKTMTGRTHLLPWLLRVTRCAGAHAFRDQARRRYYEQAAARAASSIATFTEGSASQWNELAPFLDSAVATLRKTDRETVILRFYCQRSLREVALIQGVTEGAAQKRIKRALEKLRSRLRRKGGIFSVTGLAALIGTHAAQAAPANLAQMAVATVSAGPCGTASSSTAALLAKDVAGTMTGIKMKLAAALMAVVLAGGIDMVLFAKNLSRSGSSSRSSSAQASSGSSTPGPVLYFTAKPPKTQPARPQSEDRADRR